MKRFVFIMGGLIVCSGMIGCNKSKTGDSDSNSVPDGYVDPDRNIDPDIDLDRDTDGGTEHDPDGDTDSDPEHGCTNEGTSCDDRDPCTLNDQCLAGVCQGTPRSSKAELLSTVPTFAGYRPEEPGSLQGFAAILPNNRFLFADRLVSGQGGTSLVLTELSGGDLKVLDTYRSSLLVDGSSTGGLDWTFRLWGHLVALSENRVALVVAVFQGIELLDTSGGKLTLVSRFPIQSGEPIYGAVGQGQRFWTCRPGVKAYSLQDDGTLTETGIGVSMGLCLSVALSPDGQKLFVSHSGTTLTSLNVGGENAVLDQTNPDAGAFSSLAAGAGYVAGVSLFAAAASPNVLVFDASDLSLVTRLPQQTSDRPLAVAISGHDLFVQWHRREGEHCKVAVDRYALGASGPVWNLSYPIRNTYCSEEDITTYGPAPLWAASSYTIVQPWRAVIQWHAASAVALTGPRHGAIEKLWPISGTTIDAVGPDSVHRIDLSNPLQPSFMMGGRTLSGKTQPLRFVVPEHGEFEPGLVNVQESLNGSIIQNATSAHLSRLRGGASAPPPFNAGTLLLDGGPAHLTSSGGSLFQVATKGTIDFRIRRFGSSSGLLGQGDLALSADLDQVTSLPGSPEFSYRSSFQVAADDQDKALVIAEYRRNPDDMLSTQQLLSWLSYDNSDGKLHSIVSGTVPTKVSKVALRQQRLLTVGSSVQVLEADQGQLKVAASFTPNIRTSITRILSWDGERAYLSVRVPKDNGEEGFTPMVWVLSGERLAEIARYEMRDDVLVMDSIGPNLVFGMKTGISVAVPACVPEM